MVSLSPTLGQSCGKTRAETHDCGQHGRLTVRAIARKAGVTPHAIYRRVREGVTGEELALPPHESKRVIKAECRMNVVVAAVALIDHFPDRVPTADEIMAVRPMCRRNALRWRQAMAQARRRLVA